MKQVTSVGPYGAKVTILRRTPTSKYSFRWTDPFTGKLRVETSSFRVLTKAKEEALDRSKELLQARQSGEQDRLTWQQLFKWYRAHYQGIYKGTRQAAIDRGCLAVWEAVLPAHEAVEALEKHFLLDFIERRMRGEIQPPGRKLRPCGPRTPGIDLEWLRRVVNLAMADEFAVTKNPVGKVEIPRNPRPHQPTATWERFEALRPHCTKVGSQDIFGGFMDLVVGLGWRVTALTSLHVSDIDRRAYAKAPHGRVLKREEFDKEGYRQYVPISAWLAPRIDELLAKRRALRIKSKWLFPQPTKPESPWPSSYARDRQEVAERSAGLEPLEGGDFHPWRRMWANLRKHMPLKDVAYAGCWDERTLLKYYQQTDDDTLLAVMDGGQRDPVPVAEIYEI
jgi:hypothetical protein